MRCNVACASMVKGIQSFSFEINSRVASSSKTEAGKDVWVAYWIVYASTVLALEMYGRTYPLTLALPRKFNLFLFVCQWEGWCNQGLNIPNEIAEQVSGRAGIAVQEQCLSVTYLVSCLHFSGKVFLVTMLEVLTPSLTVMLVFLLPPWKFQGSFACSTSPVKAILRENYRAQDYR